MPTLKTGKRKNSLAIPKNIELLSARSPKSTATKKKDNSQRVRGKEISVRDSASPCQIIYGKMRIGGIYTFAETNTYNTSKAYYKTGTDNSEIVWIAREVGSGGNQISIEIIASGTVGATTVSVTDKAITVTLRSSGSASLASADEVISAIQNNANSNALVRVHEGEGDGTAVVQPVSEVFLEGGGGTWLHQVITLAGHEITAIDETYLDNRLVQFGKTPDGRWSTGYFQLANGTPLVFQALNSGTNAQLAQKDLVAQLPDKWTDNHRQRGCAHVYMIFVYSSKKFPNGLPEVQFTVRGKPVYDPRTTTTTYSNNAALVIADYLMNTKFGMGVSASEIDMTALGDAADICDEVVNLAGGGSEPRYTINGAFDASERPADVLAEFAESIAGDILYQNGKWKILPAKWRPSVLALSADDVRGRLKVDTRRSRSETFNTVRGTFVNASRDYEEMDFPTVAVPTYVSEDGRTLYEDLTLNFVTSSTQAQRIAKIRLAQIRQPISITGLFALEALQLEIGDVVTYTDSQFGWTAKEFEVRDWTLKDGSNGLNVELLLVETAQAIYTWTTADELAFDPAPNTNFPDITDVPAPTNLTLQSGTAQLYVREDGTIFSRLKASWTHAESVYVQSDGGYQIQYKKTADADWNQATVLSSDTNYFYILDVQDGIAYDVRVRSVSALQYTSDWVTVANHTIIGKTAPPTDVTTFTATVRDYGILLNWNEIPDADVIEYEIRISGADWAQSNFIARTTGNNYVTDFRTAGTHLFRIKAIDTSGNYSTNNRTVSVTINAPSAPTVAHAISGENVILSWNEPTSQFAVDYYQISYGSPETVVGTIKGTVYTTKGTWSGDRTYYVKAIDVAGNTGTAGTEVVTITPPSAVQGLTLAVIDNNVKIDWDAPASSTLPIAKYRIKKGATYAGATLIGEVSATFTLVAEEVGGLITYWVVGVDTAGNEGTTANKTVNVKNPPDLVILSETDLDLTTFTLANMHVVGSTLLGPVDTTETWTTHYTGNSFTSPQDQINAGEPLYPQPTPTWCGAEKVIDYGANLPAAIVLCNFDSVIFAGTPTIEVRLWHSTDGTNFTGGSVGTSIATNAAFRYVKVRISYGTVPNGTF